MYQHIQAPAQPIGAMALIARPGTKRDSGFFSALAAAAAAVAARRR